MARQRDHPYVWVTWLPQLMIGAKICQWGVWFRAHYTDYEKVPSNFQAVPWTVQHTQMVDELAKEREALEEVVTRENQNLFHVRRSQSGLTIGGKPDLISLDRTGRYTVYDAKTGSPNDAHKIQVMLYIMFLPYSQARFKDKEFAGSIVYSNGQRINIPAAPADASFVKQASYYLDILESSTPPRKSPSFRECKFCDIGEKDCPDQIQSNVPPYVEGAEPEIPF